MVGIFNILGFSELIRRQSGLKGLYTASRTFKRRFLESLGRACFVRIGGFTRVWLICIELIRHNTRLMGMDVNKTFVFIDMHELAPFDILARLILLGHNASST